MQQKKQFSFCNDHHLLCQQYLSFLYQTKVCNDIKRKKGNIAETYGEILYPSVIKLMSSIKLSVDDVFFDLGSGLGKVVIQLFLTTSIRESYGIEIRPDLHQQALTILRQIQKDLPDCFPYSRKLTFLCGNFLEIPLSSATLLLIASPCFSPTILHRLSGIINDLSSVHSVFSLRPLPALKRLPFKKAIAIECSWDSALCYLYSTKDP